MQKTCAQCGSAFEISPGDLAFYDKLSPVFDGKKSLIPPPTLCPECRQRRRMSFRNERHLYRRKCDVTGKDIISVFPPDSPYKVCDKDHWYSEKFDPLTYGRPYDFSVPFFEQFKKLSLEVPLASLRVELSENCDFNSDMRECSNCYLCARTHLSQNMLYTYRGSKSNDCADCMQVTDCSFLYECVECVNCQDSRYLFFCSDCATSAFLLDCRNCLDCFMCCNLRKKRYCFLNEQLTKEEYEKKLKEFDFGSRRMVEVAQKMYAGIRRKAIRRNLMIVGCEDSSGDNLFNCKNCHDCFGVQKSTDCRYLWDVKLHHDSMDEYSGGRDSELMYETTSGSGSYGGLFCLRAAESQNVLYSWFVTSSKNVFGSIGLRRAKYCILNKEYSKDEYERLMPKILDHMKTTGEYGEFFPASLSPFAYNETVANEYFPLSQAETKTIGYRWQKDEPKASRDQIYAVPDRIDQVQDDVTAQILRCDHCAKNYKIVAQELAVYRERRIPLPGCCVDCRYLKRFAEKNPMRLREGTCAKCGKKMQTSYPEETDMNIYCEECYLKALP